IRDFHVTGVQTCALPIFHELMRAERIRLGLIAPRAIHGARTLIARTDAVAPMIELGKTTARPTHEWHTNLAQRRNDITADPAHVGDRRVLADPDAFVDAAPEMLDEVAVDVRIDFRTRLVRRDGDVRVDRARGRR